MCGVTAVPMNWLFTNSSIEAKCAVPVAASTLMLRKRACIISECRSASFPSEYPSRIAAAILGDGQHIRITVNPDDVTRWAKLARQHASHCPRAAGDVQRAVAALGLRQIHYKGCPAAVNRRNEDVLVNFRCAGHCLNHL